MKVKSLLTLATLLIGWTPAFTQDEKDGDLLIVQRHSTLHDFQEGRLLPSWPLPKSTYLCQLKKRPPTPIGMPEGYCYVQIAFVRTPHEGWVYCRDLQNSSASFRGNEARPFMTTDDLKYLADLPALVKRQSRDFQDSWIDLQNAIEANAKLPQPLPEPYFARGKLWSLAQNNEAALRDYQQGVSIVLKTNKDLVAYSRYLIDLHTVLATQEKTPKPPFFADAKEYYGRGFTHFWASNFELALKYFDDAVQLDPSEPASWYYRGMTYRVLGQELQARHDIRMAVHLERYGGVFRQRPYSREGIDVNEALVRVQGTMRDWIDLYRKGDRDYRSER